MSTSTSPRTGTLLGVWAHPDDEAFLSAALMADARRAGERVVVATATRGEQGTSDPLSWPPDRLAALREREESRSLAALGVTEHRWLGHHDGELPEVRRAVAVDQVAGLIDEVRPDTIVTFGPDGMTGHPDHCAVSSWTTAAWRRSGHTGRLLYATTTESFADEFADLHDRIPVFGPGLPVRTPAHGVDLTVALTAEHLVVKGRALRAQASQVRPLIEAVGDARFDDWFRNETFTAADRC